MATILRLILFDVLRVFGSWRWLAVPPVFFVAGWLGAENAAYDYETQRPRNANFWDGPFTMMMDPSAILFAFLLGFTLVSGDLYVRDRISGSAAMTLTRSRSRYSWWTAKVLALGPIALAFSTLAFLSALVASAFQLPVSMIRSQAAQVAWNGSGAIYPSFETLPMPLLLLLVTLYTAFALWAVGAVVLCVSALYPRTVTPLAMGLAWTLAGTPLIAPLAFREGVGTLDPAYQISYVVHFLNGSFSAASYILSSAVILCTLALTLIIGGWRSSRTDM